MQLLAEAEVQDLQSAFDCLEPTVASTFLIKPETGMVMVQGKADGTGIPFCIGEMTVTRCMVRSWTGSKDMPWSRAVITITPAWQPCLMLCSRFRHFMPT